MPEGSERMKHLEEIILPNQLTAEICDQSRPIAQGTVKVVFIARVRVEVKEEYFDRREHYEMTRRMFGPEVLFEYMNERTFVPVRIRKRSSENSRTTSRKTHFLIYRGLISPPGSFGRNIMTSGKTPGSMVCCRSRKWMPPVNSYPAAHFR
jgi:hypothetical protein